MASSKRTLWFFCAGFCALAVLITGGFQTAEEPPKKDSVDLDYSRELPRIKPVEPQDALKTFTVAKGFRIEQVAAEPLVTDPIAMAFDEFGRLFIVEMLDYSEDDKANLGRIRLLEDVDQDGRFDKSTIYADGLSWPTAVTCWDGGIFVGAAPDIFFLKDTDGDDKADVREVVYTGFGRGNVQGLMNTFQWGLDNRIHGATSSSGADVKRIAKSGQPPAAGDQPEDVLTLRGRDFAINPLTREMQATSGGGQHGLSFDVWGNKFVCSNSDHIQQVLFEDRYVARNPYLAAPSPRAMIAADGPQADVYRTSPVEPWRIVRTRLRVKGVVPGPVEGGGTAAGYFTGSTGVTIYRGNAWPKQYYGWAIVGDVGSNLVHRKRLDPDGLKFIARRVDEKSEFVSSTDIWFRPVQFANGPDGTLYIADMYREVIEHPLSLHPVIKKHLDLTSGRDRGRIYRIVPTEFKQPTIDWPGKASTDELVAMLNHDNDWQRETASRLLYHRQKRPTGDVLPRAAAEASRPEGRIRALYALDGLEMLNVPTLLKSLGDEHPQVRRHAVRLSERLAAESPEIRERLFALADDELAVRYQLAFTLGELPDSPLRNATLAKILRANAAHDLIRLAVQTSLTNGCGDVLAMLADDESFCKSKEGIQAIAALAAQIGRQQKADDVAAVIATLAGAPSDDVVRAIVQAINAKQESPLHKQIASATGGQAEELMKQLVESARSVAVDADANVPDRVSAIGQLRLGSLQMLQTTFETLLAADQLTDVQSAALTALATFDADAVSQVILDRWPSLSPRLRRQAADVLFSRSKWGLAFLRQLDQDKIKMADVHAGNLQLFTRVFAADLRGPAESELVKRVLGKTSSSESRQVVVKKYEAVLDQAGDATRGGQVFQKICAACHKVGALGHAIGPNLATIQNRGAAAILVNVLDPNREVNPQFLNYVVITKDGRSLSGMITAETATSITLHRAENKTDTVLRVDIEAMQSTGLSLMPEGVEKDIDQQAMADLLSYLKSLE